MPLSEKEKIRKTTLKRNWKKFNEDFSSEFESFIGHQGIYPLYFQDGFVIKL